MTAQECKALALEILISVEPFKFFGPPRRPLRRQPANLGTGAGWGDPYDRYGRGNKWGKNKTFNDYRTAI